MSIRFGLVGALIAGVGTVALSPASAAVAAAIPRSGPPGAPTQVHAVGRDRGALISWKAPRSAGGSEIIGYVIRARPGEAKVRTSAVTSFLVGGLTNGKPYRFTVTAVTKAGSGRPSKPSAPVTPRAPRAPSQARHVRASAGFEQAVVTWSPPATDGGTPVTGYLLTTKPGKAKVTVAAAATSATIAGLANGTAYRISVVAINGVGRARPAWSGRITPHLTTPAAPAGVTAAPASDGVTVAWSTPLSDGGSPLTGYVIDVNGTSKRLTAGPAASSVKFTGLALGKAYTFTVAARNSRGTGTALTSAPATAGAKVGTHTVVLSAASLAALTSVSASGSLAFTSPPAQVTGLKPGDIVVAGATPATPAGLLADVTAVTATGSTVTVRTTPASLDQALSAAGFGTADNLTRGQVAGFQPARPGVRLLPAAERPAASPPGTISLSLNTDLYKGSNGRKVSVNGTVTLTPSISFSARISCCFHTSSSFRATETAAASLSVTAQESHTISGGYTLGVIKFEPIVFDVAGVPVVILPEMPVKLIAEGSVSVGITAGVGASLTLGAQVSTDDAHVSAEAIHSHSVSYTLPTLYGSMSAGVGVEADVSSLVDGLPGPTVTGKLWLAKIDANTSANPWWTLNAELDIGLDYNLKLLDHTFASAHLTIADLTFTLAHADGPYQGVTITPNPATVAPRGTLQLHAFVARLAAQNVTWKAPAGNGSITSDGRYTAPATPGSYEVIASVRPIGLSPGAVGVISIRVGAQPPGPPTDASAVAGKAGSATVKWKAPADTGGGPITGYTVITQPGYEDFSVAGSATSATIGGLAPGGTYTFTVTASNSGGSSLPSAPTAPVRISGSSGATGTWSAPVESDPVEYTGSLNLVYPDISCVQPDWCMVVTSQNVWIYPNGLGQTPYSVQFSIGQGDWPTIVSCVSPTFCMLVQAGYAAVWNGTDLIPQQVTSGINTELDSVACPSTTFCVAGDTKGRMYTWQAGNWTGPVTVFPGTPVIGVSCPSADYCAAVTQDSAATFDGADWTSPAALGITDAYSLACPAAGWCAVGGGSGEVLALEAGTASGRKQLPVSGYVTVSCTSRSFCIAAAVKGGGQFFAWNGSKWGSAETNSGQLLGYTLTVSCATASYCAAIDTYGLGVDSYTPAQGWGYSQYDLQQGIISSMSCVSAAQCMGSDFPGNELSWNGGYWSGPAYTGVVLGQVSCPVATFCASMFSGYFEKWTQVSGWSSATEPAVPDSATDGVDCASATFCGAIDQGDVYFWNGATWSAAYHVDPAKELDALDCVSATWCMAANVNGRIFHWNGTAWSASASVRIPAGFGLSPSCPSASFCLAVSGSGAAEAWNGTAWRAVPGFTGGAGFGAVSCVSSTYCVAALGGNAQIAGNVTTWNGSGWTTPVPADPNDGITALSCPSRSFCAAGDDTGQLFEFSITSDGTLRRLPASWPRQRAGQVLRVRPGQLRRSETAPKA